MAGICGFSATRAIAPIMAHSNTEILSTIDILVRYVMDRMNTARTNVNGHADAIDMVPVCHMHDSSVLGSSRRNHSPTASVHSLDRSRDGFKRYPLCMGVVTQLPEHAVKNPRFLNVLWSK
jgi:hypothetical protein